jgi:hypothetical protein
MSERKASDVSNPIFELNFKQAKHLSDLISLKSDLIFAHSTLSLLRDKYTSLKGEASKVMSEENIIAKSLVTSALITYSRCFNKGARFDLTSEVFNVLGDKADEAKKSHKFYIDLRSKHFAHSINPFEQYQTVALVADEKLYTIGYLSIFKVGIDGTVLMNLIRVAIKHVDSQISIYDQIVLEKIQDLSTEELLKLPKSRIVVAGQENVNDVRNK